VNEVDVHTTSGTSSIGQMAPGAAFSSSIVANTASVMSCPRATRLASTRETAARLWSVRSRCAIRSASWFTSASSIRERRSRGSVRSGVRSSRLRCRRSVTTSRVRFARPSWVPSSAWALMWSSSASRARIFSSCARGRCEKSWTMPSGWLESTFACFSCWTVARNSG